MKRRRKVQPRSYSFSLWTEDKFDKQGMYLLWCICWNSDCSWRQHQLCQVQWHPIQEIMSPSSCLVFWSKRILVHEYDKAPVHGAFTVENYKDQNEVTSMEWPAQSPDLNIIENIWLYLKRELQKSAVDIATKNDLLSCVKSRACGGTSNWII